MADDDFSVSSMAKGIADGILSTAAGDLGALIINAIFPPSNDPPAYFDQVYAQITQIVDQALTQNDITMISGALNGVQVWVRDTYTSMKADTTLPASELHSELQPFVDSMIESVIGPLMTDPLAQPGFSVFLLAAGVHLSLVQEQAYTDPAHQTRGGYDSSFAKSVKKYAQQYHDFIALTWPKIKTARTNAISAVQWNAPIVILAAEPGFASWADSIDGSSVSVPGNLDDPNGTDAIADATTQRTAHVTAVLAALATSLGDPDTIAANFLELVTWPLPVTTAQILSLSGSGGASVNYDQGFQQKVYSYSLSWSTSGGTASFDGIGNVAASGSLSFNQENEPPAIPSTLTVTGPYGPPVTQQISW
jgi:hypothetical protein